MKRVSFVIPSYRSRGTLGPALDSILAQADAQASQVLVVDSSGDGSDDWIRANYPRVEVISSSSRLSPAEARNRGAAAATGEWVAFVDADAVLGPAWLPALAGELEKPGVRLVGGSIRNANPETAASRTLHWIEFSEFLPGPSRNLRAISSSNLLIRRRDFEAAGGFDPKWRMAEDLVFCRRLGAGVRFCGGAGIAHLHRDRWDDVLPHLEQLGYWSGRLRSSGLGSGAWLRKIGPVAWLLLPWRAAKIWGRVFYRSGFRSGCRCLADTPALARGLREWTRGFRRGLREESGAADQAAPPHD